MPPASWWGSASAARSWRCSCGWAAASSPRRRTWARRVAKRILPPESELLLVIDQFEELFTLTADEETRRRFLDGLTALAGDRRSRVRVVLTLRADFLDHPLRYPEFGEF